LLTLYAHFCVVPQVKETLKELTMKYGTTDALRTNRFQHQGKELVATQKLRVPSALAALAAASAVWA
jgi:hypothetical protein